MPVRIPAARVDRGGFDDHGAGEPALLFIPGWCGDRTVFDDVTQRSAVHRRSLAMDLPEHGRRRRGEADFTTGDVVDDAISLLDERGVEAVVPVALSHAGWAAIELRRRLGPDRVRGIVLLDWMVLGPPPGFTDALAGLQDPIAWSAVRSQLFSMWTSGVHLPALTSYIAIMDSYGSAYWHRAGQQIARGFAADGSPLAALGRLREPCPTLHLYAQPAEDDFLAAQSDFASSHPWFQPHRLPAQSHFPMFEIPDELAAAIEEFTCRLG